jgi:hypothetical protein
VLFTHGTVLSLFVARAAGLDPYVFLRPLRMPALVVLDRETLALGRVVPEVTADGD